jgi:hypothetical protein
MDSLVVPLRFEPSGRLSRGDRIDAVSRVLGAMLATRRADWPEAPWFGLADLVEAINVSVTDQASVAQAMNAALDQLGIDWVQVATVSVHRGEISSGELHLDVALQTTDDGTTAHRPLAL